MSQDPVPGRKRDEVKQLTSIQSGQRGLRRAESGSHHSEPVWKLGSRLMLFGHGLTNLRGVPGVYFTY